jgi:hypothetical protein
MLAVDIILPSSTLSRAFEDPVALKLARQAVKADVMFIPLNKEESFEV